MFKNVKYTLLALPVVALALTSCNNSAKTVTYDQAREFAVQTYDQRALDAIPANYSANINRMQANILVNYDAPSGGSDSFTISFGFTGIHVLIKDQYAICLSSTLIDTIERYYSDFVGLAISLKEEPPIALSYQLLGGNRSKIDVTTSEKIVGSVLVNLLQLGAGTLDILSSITGYIPTNLNEITNPVTQAILGYIGAAIQAVYASADLTVILPAFAAVLDYIGLTISDSSESYGETFDTYLTTDSFGFIDKLDFNFKSSFNITGLASYKRYQDINPKEGDHPVGTESSYRFSLTGSVDFDFDISSEIIR